MSVVAKDEVTKDIVADSTAAFNANHDVFKEGLTKYEVAEYYSMWAVGTEGDYDTERYTGPEQTVKSLTYFFPEAERSAVRILDVAAGTGRIGVGLHNQGFRHNDALDPSEGMMRKARAKGVYIIYIQDFIGDGHKVPVENGYYDAIACSGGFGEGHIPASAMEEMIRIVRTGGLICLTMRDEYFRDKPEYQVTMDQLEAKGRWRLKSKETIDHYFFTKIGKCVPIHCFVINADMVMAWSHTMVLS